MPPSKMKRELQLFLGIVNYLSKFSPMIVRVMQTTLEADICQSWMDMEQNISRNIQKSQFTSKGRHMHEILWCQEATIQGNWCIRSRCGGTLLQVRDKLNCRYNKSTREKQCSSPLLCWVSLSSMEWQYSNIKREALGILHGLDKFHHYCLPVKYMLSQTTKLIVMMGKDVAILSQCLQCIILCVHQYSGTHTIQARPWAEYCRLVILPQPWREQR